MKKITLILPLFLISTITAVSQTAPVAGPTGVPGMLSDPMNFLLVFVMAILLATILVLTRTIKLLIWQISGAPKPVEHAVADLVKEKKPTFWARMNEKLNDAVPIEKEADVLLDHDYDGIKELDNNLPPWWKYGFYLTIIFAFIYLAQYHLAGSGNVALDEYNEQMAEAELQKTERLKLTASNVDETSVTVLTADAAITNGKKIYTEKCLVCHGKAGEGLVGPNLTDDYWIHGGDIKDIFKTIKYGFPSKGMLAWQGQLTPVQMQEVASFIKTIKGTNPANPKAPQGDLYREGGIPTSANDTTVSAATADSTVLSKN